MADLWIDLIPDKVFSRVRAFFSSDIKAKYGMTANNFSTEESTQTQAVFPFVYVKELQGAEQGMTLENDTINGGLFSFQIDVTDNISRTRARKVMSEVIKIMKDMQFTLVGMPFPDDSNGVYRMSARFRRAIGANDKF